MEPSPLADVLRRAGGVATWRQLTAALSDHAVKQAVADGRLVRLARDRYASPDVEAHRAEAHRRTAVLSHLSAATAHGWAVKTTATDPWLTVPRGRHLPAPERAGLHVTWRRLDPGEREAGVTGPVRTVLDCAMALPFDQALAVADSALRARDVTPGQLRSASDTLRGKGRPRARQVVAAADARAANPFESVLRAIALGVPGLRVVPQLRITEPGVFATVDLGDERLRLVLEAEGFEHHGTRAGLVRDCRRYTELTVFGWHVLRFTWEDVMLRADRVRWALESWVQRVTTGATPGYPP